VRQRSATYARGAAAEVARCVGIRRPVTVDRALAPAWAQRRVRSEISLLGDVVRGEGARR
jgi:hypothetical protein